MCEIQPKHSFGLPLHHIDAGKLFFFTMLNFQNQQNLDNYQTKSVTENGSLLIFEIKGDPTAVYNLHKYTTNLYSMGLDAFCEPISRQLIHQSIHL